MTTIDKAPPEIRLDDVEAKNVSLERRVRELEDLLNYLGISSRATTPVPFRYDPATDTLITNTGEATITEVTVATTNNVVNNVLADAKGDIIAASAADTWVRVAVGANDTVLTADSAQTAGVKWVTGGTMQAPLFISPWSACSVGAELSALGGAALTDNVYVAANRAIYVPFYLPEAFTVQKVWWINGAAVSGNVDVAVYTAAGARQISAGSTAMAGASAIQAVDVADTALAAGDYYLAFACDNTTASFQSSPAAAVSTYNAALGWAQQAAAFALPATATFALSANTYLPFFGIANRTLVA